jgi:hypothetical protein
MKADACDTNMNFTFITTNYANKHIHTICIQSLPNLFKQLFLLSTQLIMNVPNQETEVAL